MAAAEFDCDQWAFACGVAQRLLNSPDQASRPAREFRAARAALITAYGARDPAEIRRCEAWLHRASYTAALRHWRAGASEAHRADRTSGPPSARGETADRLLAICLHGCLAAIRDAERWLARRAAGRRDREPRH